MNFEVVFSLVSLMASLSSIAFAYLAFKRSERQEQRKDAKNEGLILSDIGYIKACVDRMEKNITSVDERYREVLERLSRVEEGLDNTKRIVNEIKGG